MNVNIFVFSICSRSYITSFGQFCKYDVLANMSRDYWLIYTAVAKQSACIMCNILLSLRCIAVRFFLFPLHAPDGKRAHEQNVDKCQTHIAIQNVDEEIWGKIAVVVQIISPQRYDAVAHQKRQHNERGNPADDKPCNLLFVFDIWVFPFSQLSVYRLYVKDKRQTM